MSGISQNVRSPLTAFSRAKVDRSFGISQKVRSLFWGYGNGDRSLGL
ncbi:hypothetical protein [Microcoleus sp. N9_A1]